MPTLKDTYPAPFGAGTLRPIRNSDGMTSFRYHHKVTTDNTPATIDQLAMDRNGIVADSTYRQCLGNYEVTHSRRTKGNSAPNHTVKIVIPTIHSVPSGTEGVDIATVVGQSLVKVEVVFDPKATEETRKAILKTLGTMDPGKPVFNAAAQDASFV